MKKTVLRLAGLALVLIVLGVRGEASATMLINNVSLTQNSVTFTIDGDMTGYSITPYQPSTFSLLYSGNIFLSDSSHATNTWSASVFDNHSFTEVGYTGTWYSTDYTWSWYDNDLSDATATNRTITVSTTNNYFNTTGIGQIEFQWGHPFNEHVVLASIDINGGSAPVPEPSTMLLLGAGLAGLAFWRKRRS